MVKAKYGTIQEKVVFTRCHLQARSRQLVSIVYLVQQLEHFRADFTQGVKHRGDRSGEGRDAYGGYHMSVIQEEIDIKRLQDGTYALEYRCCLRGRVPWESKEKSHYAERRITAAYTCFSCGLEKVLEPTGRLVVCVLS